MKRKKCVCVEVNLMHLIRVFPNIPVGHFHLSHCAKIDLYGMLRFGKRTIKVLER